MLASKREFEERKNQIKPEDDPFWDKRGGKGERFYPKYQNVSEKQTKDIRGNVIPLSSNSRLLTPTKAAIFGTYHKDSPINNKTISPLPVTSHLLTPTKASSRAEYHPSTPSSTSTSSSSSQHQHQQRERDNSPPKSIKSNHSGSGEFHSATLHEMTANRRASLWEKKASPEPDPREEGWKNILLDKKTPGIRDVSSVPLAKNNTLFKDVKSKLHNHTIASSHQMWNHQNHNHHSNENGEGNQTDLLLDEDGIERDFDDLRLDEGSEIPGEPILHGNQSFIYTNKKYADICSRLYEPTTAAKASMWANRMPSPPPRRRRSIAEESLGPPEVQSKMTKAQQYAMRQKYVKYDSKDISEIDKKNQELNGKRSHRSASAPVFGRIYAPAVHTPSASRAQLVQRFTRPISPSPMRPLTNDENINNTTSNNSTISIEVNQQTNGVNVEVNVNHHEDSKELEQPQQQIEQEKEEQEQEQNEQEKEEEQEQEQEQQNEQQKEGIQNEEY
eukprot:CAMPEP_0174822102 /NCGR_PEP_ID=MMETSP1107-20130205/13226_1 /TAXON_ID=36770 /ORGANISM="Paraphysomonas vestita, Strain GFlagA" /LENGTH=501 /DNA_ID=CAMNT_0016040123 /DNA_START=95 /DNA_END=1600 /DNA_ORIENTATION=+